MEDIGRSKDLHSPISEPKPIGGGSMEMDEHVTEKTIGRAVSDRGRLRKMPWLLALAYAAYVDSTPNLQIESKWGIDEV